MTYRYGQYHDGPDPLAAPYDARLALDEMGDAVLGGSDPGSALRDLIRRGMQGQRGLDDVLRRVRERQQEVRRRGRLDGIVEQARALLDTAIGQERAELFPDPGDDARMREAELDSLPSDTAQAIRRLADYDWRSAAARGTFEQLKDLLRRQVLDSQFRGMRDALENRTRRRCSGSRTCWPTSTRCWRRTRGASTPRPTSMPSWTATGICSRTIRPTWRS